MAAPQLQPGEKIVYSSHPESYALVWFYLFTLGLYEIWRRASYFVVTDHRVIRSSGLVTKSQRSVPVDMVQDASVRTQLGVGFVMISTAGGIHSVISLGPTTAATARELCGVIIDQREQARNAGRPAGAGENDMTGQLQKLHDLRAAGILTDTEFEEKKVAILKQL